MSEEAKPSAAAAVPPPEKALDLSRLIETYANFFRVYTTPEELILDFGGLLPTEPAKVASRIILNYYSAKRLLIHLHRAVQNHEAQFGPIELDHSKRLRPKDGPIA